MLALMVPTTGMPFFEHVPETHRGNRVSIVVCEGRDVVREGRDWSASVEGFLIQRFVRVDFRWVSEFRRKDGSELFDLFEEV